MAAAARRRILVVANRGPVVYDRDEAGGRVVRRAGGGLANALSGLISQHDVTWIASAMTDEDRAVAGEQGGAFEEVARDGSAYRMRLVAHDRQAYDRFYNVVANPTLWFLQHYLWGLAEAPSLGPELYDAWRRGYVPVNEALAEATLAELELQPDAAVFFHDYHLYLAPALVRERRPEAVTSHFVHIPWPQPDYWHALPAELRDAIHSGLLANDVVGLHTRRWRDAFLACCSTLLGAEVDGDVVSWRGHRTRVTAHPIAIDPGELERLADGAAVLERERALLARRPERLVVRVDRTDPSKNIVRGFDAFGLLLERHPELHGRVGMLALLAPSRQDIPEYADYVVAIEAAVSDVNERFGRDDWTPVVLDIADDFPRSLAGYRQFDVLLVNPVFDGLNLIAKEGMLVNRRDGVLVLSENSGAHEELGAWAVSVNPFDLVGQADALYEALTMPEEERRRRGDAIRAHVREHDLRGWIAAQLADLDATTIEAR